MREYLDDETIAKFWQRVAKGGHDACWEWQGSCGKCGYGRLWLRANSPKKYLEAHRVAYYLAYGDLPADKPLVCHTCDNPPCCNPAHLFAGDHTDNNRDKVAKGRARYNPPSGDRAAATHLTDADVLEIRRLYCTTPMLTAEIGSQYGVRPSGITEIVQGKRWKHLPVLEVPEWKRVLGRKRPGNGAKKGARTKPRKFNDAQVAAIRAAYAAGGVRQEDLAETYGVHRLTIHNVILGKGSYR